MGLVRQEMRVEAQAFPYIRGVYANSALHRREAFERATLTLSATRPLAVGMITMIRIAWPIAALTIAAALASSAEAAIVAQPGLSACNKSADRHGITGRDRASYVQECVENQPRHRHKPMKRR